jgi:hypothetical protein
MGTALSSVGMLIHEIWLFMFFPVLMSVLIINHSLRKMAIPLILVTAPTLVVAVLLYAYGNLSPAKVDAYYRHLLATSGFIDNNTHTGVNGFYASVKALGAGWLPRARELFFSAAGLKRCLSGLLVVWPFIAYWWLFWHRVCRTLPFGFMYLVVAAPLVSFALLPIALDYSRYLAWMAWNMLFLIAISKNIRSTPRNLYRRHKALALCSLHGDGLALRDR